jgi:drug/metabolite transporter (DMT)-like permease
MIIAALGFATMGALVKVGATKFTSMELVFYRSIFGLVFIGFYINKQKLSTKTNFIGKHIARSVVGFSALILFFYAIAHLPLATAITLSNTSALFLGLLTPLILKEKPKLITFITLLTGFIGVSLLLQPNIQESNWFASIIGLLAGFGAAIAYILVKQLGKLDEPDWLTVYYFTLVSTIGAAIGMVFTSVSSIALGDTPVLIGLGLSATIAQLAMTRAYRTGSTLVVACLGYSTPILASLFGILFWQEALTTQAWIAIAIIIASSMVNTLTSHK